MRDDSTSRRGSLIIIALVLVVVVMGLAGSYQVVANVQSSRAVEAIERGKAERNAEAGVDHARVLLMGLVDPSAEDRVAAWDGVLAENGGRPAWVTDRRTMDGGYTVRVRDNDDGDGDLYRDQDEIVELEALGYGTPQGVNGTSHVIRCTVALDVNDPTSSYAILAGEDLYMYGSPDTIGTLGRVHANEDLTVQGSVYISRAATASGTTTTVGSGVEVEAGITGDAEIVPIEPIVPADYRPYSDRILTSDGRVLDGASGQVLYAFSSSESAAFEGFTWSSSKGWSTATSGWIDGKMYYIEADISFTKGGTSSDPWQVTLVAEGSIVMTGSTFLMPYYRETELLVAGEDVYARGTGATSQFEGLILAHEQIDLSGNISVYGRVLAESALNTTGSAVDTNTPLSTSIGGGVTVEYNGRLKRSLVTDFWLPIRSWREELPANVDSAGDGA